MRPAEPCTISADAVASYLERYGWVESARLVRDLSQRDTERNQWAAYWQSRYEEALKRLHKYEPPEVVAVRPDYTPPPESSD